MGRFTKKMFASAASLLASICSRSGIKIAHIQKPSAPAEIEWSSSAANDVLELTTSFTLAAMQRNLAVAKLDRYNELMHLYEIRNLLLTELGSGAARVLGISKAEWTALVRICNDAPVRQGYHRGGGVSPLRDATDAELEQCRAIASKMVSMFVLHLQRK